MRNQLTNFMEQRAFWEPNRSSASQEVPRMLRNPKVHYRIQKSPPPLRILSKKTITFLELNTKPW